MARGTRWRATAWGLALLWALLPALAAIHGAVENHVYCAEHGAFEHGDADHGGELPGTSIAATDNGDVDAHDLCGFSDCLLRTAVETDAPVLVSPVAAPLVAAATPVDASTAHALPVLVVAPKASPPAV